MFKPSHTIEASRTCVIPSRQELVTASSMGLKLNIMHGSQKNKGSYRL